MRIRGIDAAKRAAGWVESILRPGPLILGYHRVVESSWDPQRLCVSPANFAEQIEIMTRVATPVSQQRLLAAMREGRNLERSIVITIDDGYADSFELAAPILERLGVPSTVFVTTAMIGGPIWWCEIQHLVEQADSLPAEILVSSGNGVFHWTRVADSRNSRARLMRMLSDFFRSLPFEQQIDALAEVREAFGSRLQKESGVKAMTADQIRALAKSSLVEIGSHMVTHVPLNQLGVEEQRAELRQSKAELEDISGFPVVSCAYPNGKFSTETPKIARELGFAIGYTTVQKLAAPGTDPLLLPRLWPGDWNGDRFSRWLRRWLR